MKAPFLIVLFLSLSAAYPSFAETLAIAVETAEASADTYTNEPVVTIRLKPESRDAFGDFTRARIGEAVQLRLGTTVLSAPIVQEPIVGGILVISGQLTADTARELADRLSEDGATLQVDGSDR